MTLISNKGLIEKCGEFIKSNSTDTSLDMVIKDALITSNREICEIDGMTPLAWMREEYDEMFTRCNAEISAITQANPGVATAESVDPDLSSDTGFYDDDIVWVDGIDGMERLNRRFYIGTRASDTTLTFTQLDGINAISTASYDEYSAGGGVFHAGLILPASSIEPTAAQESTASYRWTIKRVWDVTFDGYPATPISEEMARNKTAIDWGEGRPDKWYYKKYYRGAPSSVSHRLFWFGWSSAKYNIKVFIEKQYPDLSVWDSKTYSPHPEEVHDYIWHRALANLATRAEQAKRQIEGDKPSQMGKIEILYAQLWQAKKIEDEARIKKLSRSMIGDLPRYGGMSA